MATKIRAKRESGLTTVRLKRDPPVPEDAIEKLTSVSSLLESELPENKITVMYELLQKHLNTLEMLHGPTTSRFVTI